MALKKSHARAFLPLLAFLTGSLVAAFFRDLGNRFENYPGLLSTKAGLAFNVIGSQGFLHMPVTMANGALNLGAWMGHQEVKLDHAWAAVPAGSLRVRGEGAAHFELELATASAITVLRLSNDPSHPSAWIVADPEGTFQRRQPIAYELPRDAWVEVKVFSANGMLGAHVNGRPLPAFPAPMAPLKILLRGDSSAGVLQVNHLSFRLGTDAYEQEFSGKIPWAILLSATLGASLLLALLERLSDPRIVAGIGGSILLVLFVFFVFWSVSLSRRYPLALNISNSYEQIKYQEKQLKRLAASSALPRPILLWLGGSQAWGAGASSEAKTVFSRLRASTGGLGYAWVNGAISGTRVLDQKSALDAVRGKIATIVLVAGVNDSENPRFTSDLAALAEAARARKARLILIPEPVEPSRSDVALLRQGETVAFGNREKIPTIILQSALDRHADDGFFWWDFVHLSDAGAKFVAAQLAPKLKEVIPAARQRKEAWMAFPGSGYGSKTSLWY